MSKLNRVGVCEDGLIGNFYFLETMEKSPALLLVSGSDGGIPGSNAISEFFIEYLVENGFAVLALAYFGVDGLPTFLENIPLEYFRKAFQWLKKTSQVDGASLGMIGHSRGAELALLFGSYFPKEIQAIVASSPSHLICGGFPHPNVAAWTYQNLPISPFLSGLSNLDPYLCEAKDLELATDSKKISYHANTSQDPYVISDLFSARYKMMGAEKTQIPVENIECPILLLSGTQDAIWPASFSCEKIMEKLKTSKKGFLREHVDYKDAGHGILNHYDGSIYHPTGHFWCKLGGTLEGNKRANEQSWKVIKNFLQKTLCS